VNTFVPFPQLLYVFVQAFHLDDSEPDLCSTGRFQHILTGRRIDRRDQATQDLFRSFARSLLASGIFPAINYASAEDPQRSPPSALVRQYAGDHLPPSLLNGTPEALLAEGLFVLAERYEQLGGEVRSQSAATIDDPAFALLPSMRFLSHHLSLSLGLLLHAGALDARSIERGTLAMSWGAEEPTVTPFAELVSAREKTRSTVKNDWDDGSAYSFNRKTVDSLWVGGPEQPDLSTLRRALLRLDADAKKTLPALRRWYGLRDVAHRMNEIWGWDFVNGWLGTLVSHAHEVHASLRNSSLSPAESVLLARLGLWVGWDLPVCQWFLDLRARHEAFPGYAEDFAAISRGAAALRFLELAQLASGGSGLTAEFMRRGYPETEARQLAVKWVCLSTGSLPTTGDDLADAVAGLKAAKRNEDWAAGERHARTLVDRRPDVSDNHVELARMLQMQRRWEDALSAARVGQDQHPSCSFLRIIAIEIEMDRAGCRGDPTGFQRAISFLRALPPLDHSWATSLLEADCCFALGEWDRCIGLCTAIVESKPDCGEAHALGSICNRKIGDARREAEWARKAGRRGSGDLLALLLERDRRGELGSRGIAPIPRWHRMSQ
jgi:hypothetical protein